MDGTVIAKRSFTQDQAVDFVGALPWGAAAGTCKDRATALRFARAGMKIVTWGSITLKQRDGNPGDNFYYDEATGNSINALGIPNAGIDAYIQELAGIRREVNALGAQFWVSISAGAEFSALDYHDMVGDLVDADAADVVEGNKSCGNIVVDGVYKPVVCFDHAQFDAGVRYMCSVKHRPKIAIKHAPTTDPGVLKKNVEICLKHGVDYLIFSNTLPNCYLEKPDGTPAIDMKRGGLGGKGLKPIVTSMLQMAAPWVEGTSLQLLAAGGVDEGADAYHYLKHHAKGFLFNTALTRRKYDPKVGNEIAEGLVKCLVEQGL